MNRAEILNEAKDAITVDRQQTHGKPENNFAITAAIWAALNGAATTALGFGRLGYDYP